MKPAQVDGLGGEMGNRPVKIAFPKVKILSCLCSDDFQNGGKQPRVGGAICSQKRIPLSWRQIASAKEVFKEIAQVSCRIVEEAGAKPTRGLEALSWQAVSFISALCACMRYQIRIGIVVVFLVHRLNGELNPVRTFREDVH